MKVLGISCFYHDSAVAVVEDGRIVFALQEERVSRLKHDSRFPIMAITRAMEMCKSSINDFDEIVFYEYPDLKLTRIFEQVISGWPRSWRLFSEHLPYFYHFKYPVEKIIRDKLGYRGRIGFCEHHRSHAASAFYTSPFDRALVVTIDGVGEYDTTAVHIGEGNTLRKVASIHFPDSLGLLYSVFTHYLGFEVNEGEYKVMGLASYGDPVYVDRILNKIIFLREDGSFYLNQRYFDFSSPDRHYRKNLIDLLGVPPREPKEPISKEHMDLAASIQKVLERAMINMIESLRRRYPCENLCMAGGVALNCTANAEVIRRLGMNVYIHPAAGDAGGALGAALDSAIQHAPHNPYRFEFSPYLGIEYPAEAIKATLEVNHIPYRRVDNISLEIAKRLAGGSVVAIFHGRDEWGPRALGNRSILADPRKACMKDHLNAKIKFREEFRPFAPVVMQEHYDTYFETLGMEHSPYMLFTHKAKIPDAIPAVVHADGTSRVQTVTRDQNPYLYDILADFFRITGIPVLINTSFNLKGEPIVSSPSDALNTFFASGIDCLALEDFLVEKGAGS